MTITSARWECPYRFCWHCLTEWEEVVIIIRHDIYFNQWIKQQNGFYPGYGKLDYMFVDLEKNEPDLKADS